jgi:hypothetical protein
MLWAVPPSLAWLTMISTMSCATVPTTISESAVETLNEMASSVAYR